MDPQELLMQIMGQHETAQSGINLNDPSAVNWDALVGQLQLTPEELQELQIPEVRGGPSLAERLQRLRPDVDIGRLNLELSGQGVRGRLEF